MCSILIFSGPDVEHPDPTQDWKRFKRGDVVDVRDDDSFFWGNAVHGPANLGLWRIIILAGVPAEEMIGLAMGDPIKPEDFATPTPRRIRVNKIDLDLLEAREKNNADSGVVTKVGDKISVVMSKDDLLSVRTTKPALE